MQQKTITAVPGTQGYILVRAVGTDSAGNPVYSDYASLPYTVPGTSPSGGNILTVNSNGDVQLAGGSIYAGSFPTGTGTLNVVTGTTTGTGVVLNQTGLAGFASGVKEFYIDASTGKAYFGGNLTAGTIKIGPGVGPLGQNGIYINAYNYWYDDGTWAATGNNIAGALQGGSILKPAEVTGLTAGWNGTTTMTVSFSFDITGVVAGVSSNQYAQDFIITLTPLSGSAKTVKIPVNKAGTSQSYALTLALNQSLFGIPVTQFSSIEVQVEDSFGNITTGTTISAGYNYVSPLSAPSSLTIVPVNNGYTVSYTAPTDPSFAYIEIAESTSSSSGPFNTVYTGKLNPATVITSSLSARWVEARFVDVLGVATTWYIYGSSIQPVSPTTISTAAPLPVTVNSAGFTSSGTGEDVSIAITAYNKSITAASGTSTITYTTGTTAHGFVNGDQVVISGITGGTGFNTSGIVSGVTTYTFQLTSQSASGTPTSYAGAVVQYANVTYIAKLTSGTHNGYFYLTPDGTSNVSQTFTIFKRDMYNQFGAYYYTFSGLFITTGSNGVNNTGASITSFSRTATVTSTTPILSTYAVADGYTATYDFSGTNATYGEVYQKHTSWGTITISIDYLTGTFVSNTTNQLVLSNVIDVDGNVITTAGDVNGAFPTGYQIFGANVPANTYITAVSYAAPNFTLTLNNSLTSTGSGTYRANALVYSGTSPANITNNLYDPFYVLVRYYDDFGFASNMSNISTVTPNNASSISNFTNAVNIGGTAGSVYVGAALKSATISTVSGSGTLMTYTTSTAHGLSSTDVVTVSGVVVGGTTVNGYNVTSSAITVTGTTTFTISGTQTGSGTGGFVANNGARVFMASSANTNNTSGYAGIFAFDNTGAIATTSLIANPGSGGYTFKTVNANIADWVIDSTHIQNTLGASANYVGLSATGPYSFWAGSGTSGNTTGNANFSVTPTGNVLAKNISIVGSGTSSGIWASGNGTTVTYTTNTAHGLVPGQYVNITGLGTGYNVSNVPIATVPTSTTFTIAGSGASTSYGTTVTTAVGNATASLTIPLTTSNASIVAGMLVTGTGIPAGTYVASVSTTAGITTIVLSGSTTVTLSGVTLSFSNGGIVTPVLLSAGGLFNVTGTGALSSTSANITGSITANYGSVQGNLKVGGSIYSGTTLAQSIVGVLPGVPAAGTVRYALSSAHSLTTNSTVYISGISPSGYSGVFKVTDVSTATTTSTGNAGTSSTAVTINVPNSSIVSGQYVIGAGLPSGGTTVAGAPTNTTNFTLSQASVLSNTSLTFVSSTALGTGTGTATASTTVTLTAGTSGIANGQYVIGAGVPNGTTVVSRTPTTGTPTSVVLSNSVTLASVPLTFVSPTAVTTAVGTAGTSSTTVTLTAANSNIIPGMIVTGTGVPANTYVLTNVTPFTSITLNNPVFLSSAALTFTAGTIDVTNATTGGATISSVDPIAQVTDITSGYILNPTGLIFNNATTQGITSINGSTGLFTTASANIGNWLVDSSTISKTANSGKLILNSGTYSANITVVSGTGTITFTTSTNHNFSTGQLVTFAGFGTSTTTYNNATAVAITVTGPATFTAANTGTGTPASYGVATVTDTPSIYTINSGGTYSAGIAGANNSSDKVFWAGASKTSPNFYVQADGTLVATNATVSGSVTANTIVAGASISSPIISSPGMSATSTTTSGFYLNAGTTPSFLISNGTSYLQYSGGALNIVGGSINGGFINGGTITSSTFSTAGGNAGYISIAGASSSGSIENAIIWHDTGGYQARITTGYGQAALYIYAPSAANYGISLYGPNSFNTSQISTTHLQDPGVNFEISASSSSIAMGAVNLTGQPTGLVVNSSGANVGGTPSLSSALLRNIQTTYTGSSTVSSLNSISASGKAGQILLTLA